MVKIRLRRIGTKGRPFYRVVVADGKAGRNGSFVETIGIYDPISNPKRLEIKEDRALYWLLQGGQPTETTAYLLSKVGVIDRFLAERPAQKKNFSFLDKRTAAISVARTAEKLVAEAPPAEPTVAPSPAPEATAPATPAAETPAPETAAPELAASEAAVAETPVAEAPAAETSAAESAE